jgi:hypothetical protein
MTHEKAPAKSKRGIVNRKGERSQKPGVKSPRRKMRKIGDF